MDFKFFLISIIVVSCFVGTAFAQTVSIEKEFSQAEIDEMKHKAVLLTLHDGTMLIELFPEDAPHTVYNFLNLVESGYYDGIIFHRIIPNFMIQGGDPLTKDLEGSQDLWGTGGPGYSINEEFNTLQHDRGMVSMARSADPNSAGSQFFIVHQDSNFLDAEYTVFGRLVSGTHSLNALDKLANLETNTRDVPVDASRAKIVKATILDPFFPNPTQLPPERMSYIVKEMSMGGGITNVYTSFDHDVSFHLPYRWNPMETSGPYLSVLLEPGELEHSVQQQIEQSGFIPQVLIFSEERNVMMEGTELNTGFFSIRSADDPEVLSNYVFENDDGRKAHMMITTQNVESDQGEDVKFKILQLHFTNSDINYSIIYLNTEEFFRYEVNAFHQVAKHFEILIEDEMQPINFTENPIYQQVISDAKGAPEPEPAPPARIGGCLIATASYGSELAPQVQLLREMRDNTVLKTQSGTLFMNGFNQFYYSFSPAVADYERENPVFKEAVKLTLTPLLASLTLLQYVDIDSESEMLGYGIGIILLNIGVYFVAPAILITKIRSFYKLQ